MRDIDPTLFIISSKQGFSNLVLDRGRALPREDELFHARKSSSSSSNRGRALPRFEDELVFDRRRTNRLIKKLDLVKYCWMKLMCHNGPNHPAKYGCLGVRSYKVGFSLVNRVSLIFKEDI